MFTTTSDPYVSPVPSEHLAKTGVAKLSKDISVDDELIYIDDLLPGLAEPDFPAMPKPFEPVNFE
jgi:hypothetical protein